MHESCQGTRPEKSRAVAQAVGAACSSCLFCRFDRNHDEPARLIWSRGMPFAPAAGNEYKEQRRFFADIDQPPERLRAV